MTSAQPDMDPLPTSDPPPEIREEFGDLTKKLRGLSREAGLVIGPHAPIPPRPDIVVPMADLLDAVIKHEVSDVFLQPGVPPAALIQGKLKNMTKDEWNADRVLAAIYDISDVTSISKVIRTGDADLGFGYAGRRFRVNLLLHDTGIGAVMRLLPAVPPSIEKIGIPQQMLDTIKMMEGLFLVTGVTGSGKTTTLASMLKHLIETTNNLNIITIEDPIEFKHKSKESVRVWQREVGKHTKNFESGLRAALREAPDIILVGELRDYETIAIAMQAAETGHLVMGTLHTDRPQGAITRIADSFPKERQEMIRVQLSESLIGVATQRLIPSSEGDQRVALFDFMSVDTGIANMIRKGDVFRIDLGLTAKSNPIGHLPRNEHLRQLLAARKITKQTYEEYSK
ncbi:MAG: PilT/PilU family type 4a pilus ATPase [Bdellovibrionota bacterium]